MNVQKQNSAVLRLEVKCNSWRATDYTKVRHKKVAINSENNNRKETTIEKKQQKKKVSRAKSEVVQNDDKQKSRMSIHIDEIRTTALPLITCG